MNKKLIRITTVPISLLKLLSGQLRFMNSFYEVTAVSSEKENLRKIGESQEVNIFHLELTRKITPVQDFIAIVKLFFFLKNQKPFIVHTHTPKAGLVGMIASKLANVPHRLHTVAGLPLMEATGNKRKLLDFVEKLTYMCATKVYPNSNGLYDFILKNHFTKKEKLKVIANGSSNGINTSYFDPKLYSDKDIKRLENNLGISTEDFVFIFVGRIVADKGINELILAFVRLSLEMDNVKLLLVGPLESDLDPLTPETLRVIADDKKIISVGFQNDVRSFFAIADALVFPSYREGFPNVVMQAGAMGLPSIVTNINGCNEIIEEGVNGIIIPPKNIESLYVAMKAMVNNKINRKQLSENARNLIISRYEQQFLWDALLIEYKGLLIDKEF